MKIVSVRMSEEVIAEIDKFAKMQDRDRSYIINKAMRAYIAKEKLILDNIQEGIDDMEAGRGRSYEDFKKEMAEYIKSQE
ncbi:MAG: ribbon-helix-helix protein, CopG family [Alphaproteobacteria bacterium]|nr:ribbon-helix-helix protein, CopG family [Alphaproteobacteria bacterium]